VVIQGLPPHRGARSSSPHPHAHEVSRVAVRRWERERARSLQAANQASSDVRMCVSLRCPRTTRHRSAWQPRGAAGAMHTMIMHPVGREGAQGLRGQVNPPRARPFEVLRIPGPPLATPHPHPPHAPRQRRPDAPRLPHCCAGHQKGAPTAAGAPLPAHPRPSARAPWLVQGWATTCIHAHSMPPQPDRKHACNVCMRSTPPTTHTCTHVRTHTHACTHAHTHARTHAHTHARTHATHQQLLDIGVCAVHEHVQQLACASQKAWQAWVRAGFVQQFETVCLGLSECREAGAK